MKYFLHDTGAFEDEKIHELFIEFGYEGLGLFYTILEKIAKQEKPIKTTVLKSQLKVGKKLEKCWLFMEVIGLLSSNNGETFNKQLLNHSEKYKIKKENNAKRIKEWRDKELVKENVTHSEQISNNNVTPVNESKVNESKGIEVKEPKPKKVFTPPSIEDFKNYFKENGFKTEVAERAWKGYDVADWHDSQGKKVKNWKQKCLNVWFKDENKISNRQIQPGIQAGNINDFLKPKENKY